MSRRSSRTIEQRVADAADAALTQRQFVSAVDVLIGLGWLTPSAVDRWRQGRVDSLEEVAQVDGAKLAAAVEALRRWAADRGLDPIEITYLARTRDQRPLRFSDRGDQDVEQAFRIHWVSPELPDSKRERVAEKQGRPPDLVVIAPVNPWACTNCGGTGDLLFMEGPGPLCLACADLDHLVFLPAGDAAMTRRARKASGLSAVVVRFSRTRGRYERQGVLVEEEALAEAERACLADEEARRRRRERDESRRAVHDIQFQRALADGITHLFPGCPPARADAIARHTAARGSGRVGRSAAGRALDADAITLAVAASVRHLDTAYDRLLMAGVPRPEARARVATEVETVLDRWREPPAG